MKKKFATYFLGVYLFCFDGEFEQHLVNPMELVSKNLSRKKVGKL